MGTYVVNQGWIQRFGKVEGAIYRPPWLADEENFRFQMVQKD